MRKLIVVTALLVSVGYAVDVDDYFRWGIGGEYNPHQAKDADIDNYGGYIRTSLGYSFLDKRFRIGTHVKLGGTKSSMKNASTYFQKNKGSYVSGEILAKLGVNLLSADNPLYLNVLYVYDAYAYGDNPIKDPRDELFASRFHRAGLEFEGFVKRSSASSIQYAISYDYITNGAYHLPHTNSARSSVDGHTIQASLGYARGSWKDMHYYIQGKVQYQRLSASSAVVLVNSGSTSYPSAQRYYAGIEIGFGFNL